MDFLQIRDDRELSGLKKQCIAQLQRVMLPTDTLTTLNIPHYDNVVKTVNESDWLRTVWLSEHPFGVYVDDDCWMEYRYEPPRDGLMRLPRYRKGEPLPDIFIIYRNGSEYWFERNFDLRRRANWIHENVSPTMQEDFYGWPHEMMLGWKGFEYLPDDLYMHKGETMSNEIQRRETMSEGPHINDLAAMAVEKLVLAAGEILKIRDAANYAGDQFHGIRAEHLQLKAQMAEIAAKIKAGEEKAAKEALVAHANTDIQQPT